MEERSPLAEFVERTQAVTAGSRVDFKILLELGNIFLAEMQENFRVGGRPTPWLQSSRVKQFGGQTLLRTARLMRSLTASAGPGYTAIGTNLVYGRIHALGGVIRAKKAKYLAFRVPAGMQSVGRTGRGLSTPKKLYAWVRVKEVTMPRRDFTFISESGFSRGLKVLERYMATGA